MLEALHLLVVTVCIVVLIALVLRGIANIAGAIVGLCFLFRTKRK